MIPTRLPAFANAPEVLFTEGKEKLSTLFPNFEFDYKAHQPMLLYFLSGGSERYAIEAACNSKFCLLMAGEGNNAYAAATEVKAHLDQLGVDTILMDCSNETELELAAVYFQVFAELEQLRGKKLGLIGNPSDWLVASGIEKNLLAEKFGVHLQKIEWDKIPDYNRQTEDEQFLDKFRNCAPQSILAASRVSVALQKAIDANNLDAITVECFPMVQKDGVTACLALSHLNDSSFPAGCEGDLTSIVGMMMVQAVTGIIPWMANVIKVSDATARFAHCTAPTGLLSDYTVDTHFETGKGTAVAGNFAGNEVTVFRLSNRLDKAFLARGEIVATHASPENACRTMIEVHIQKEKAQLLKEHPLGNHHLIVPGNMCSRISKAARLKGIRILD
jgi:L-fucose isomerase-like protein